MQSECPRCGGWCYYDEDPRHGTAGLTCLHCGTTARYFRSPDASVSTMRGLDNLRRIANGHDAAPPFADEPLDEVYEPEDEGPSVRLEAMNLSPRAEQALRRANVTSVPSLLGLDPAMLFNTTFGKVAFRNLSQTLVRTRMMPLSFGVPEPAPDDE